MAQAPQPAPPLPKPVNYEADPILRSFVWRSIGPANMGGRIDDIAVDENDPSTFYIGMATGGIWKTTNNGTTWSPIFDRYPVASVGDIALAPSDPKILYVGTGEPNNRQSSSFGAGVYKSTDGGENFEYVGLKETQTIARVIVHPKDPAIVYVAAVGHLFGPNPERGLYKTTDGGKTWTNTKFIDNDTGFTEVVMHPTNPNILFAASYQRRRQPWGFNGGGPGSAIWRTTDGAKTWTRLTGNGLPENPIIGRIGLDIARSQPSTIYASIEVGPSGGTGAGVNDDGTLAVPGQGRGGGGGRGNQPPPPPDPKKSGIWRSDDNGKTWRFLSNQGDRWMYYSKIRIDPTNPEIAYQGGAPFFKTVDGGKTWRTLGGIPHSDHHAFWINPRNNNHIILGNDGGLDMSYDQGETWEYLNTMPLGQFYAVSADMRKPYLRLRRPAGQRQLVRTELVALGQRRRELRLVPYRGRRRVFHGERSHRLGDGLLGVAGRQHEPDRSQDRPIDVDSTAADGSGRARRGRRRRGRLGEHVRPAARGAVRRRRTERRADTAARHHVPLLLEHSVHPVAAQSANRLSRRRSAVPLVQPR